MKLLIEVKGDFESKEDLTAFVVDTLESSAAYVNILWIEQSKERI